MFLGPWQRGQGARTSYLLAAVDAAGLPASAGAIPQGLVQSPLLLLHDRPYPEVLMNLCIHAVDAVPSRSLAGHSCFYM